jgi:hypothetical protein
MTDPDPDSAALAESDIVLTEDGEEALSARAALDLVKSLVELLPLERQVITLTPVPPIPDPGTGSNYRASRRLLIHPDEKPHVFKSPKGKWTVDYQARTDAPVPLAEGVTLTYINSKRHGRSLVPYDTWDLALGAANKDVESRLCDWVAVNDGLMD